MRTRWPLRRLGQCVRFLSGGTPSKIRTDFWEGDIPWVSSGEMDQVRISDTALHISEGGLEDGSRLVEAGTILVVVRGMSLAKDFRVAITTRPMAFNQDLKALACVSDVDARYLFCALRANRNRIRNLASEASHGTKKLPTDVLEAVEVYVPDLVTQRRTADAIWAFDDLIENNTRRMVLLEQSARLLYEEWFVRLRFPGREHTRITNGVPEGWERTTIASCADVEDGDWIESKDQGGEDYRLLQISNIGINDFVETGNFRFVTEGTFRRLNCREVVPGDILVSRAEREIFVNSFLGQFFPPAYRFSSGDITDSQRNRSGQVDVIVELPLVYSIPLLPDGPRLHMAEGVAVAIEVKSNLSSQWEEVLTTARMIKRLRRRFRTDFEEYLQYLLQATPSGSDEQKDQAAKKLQELKKARESMPHATIPVLAVGFQGWGSEDALDAARHAA